MEVTRTSWTESPSLAHQQQDQPVEREPAEVIDKEAPSDDEPDRSRSPVPRRAKREGLLIQNVQVVLTRMMSSHVIWAFGMRSPEWQMLSPMNSNVESN